MKYVRAGVQAAKFAKKAFDYGSQKDLFGSGSRRASTVSMSGDSVRSVATSGGKIKMKPCRPRVKVSRKFKAKVQVAAAQHTAKGTYTTYKQGYLPHAQSANVQNADQALYQGISGTLQLQTQKVGNATIGGMFEFFTPRKAHDAASVLFNGKVSNLDFIGETLNNFELTNLVLEIPHMSVELKFKNQGQQTEEIEFYECVAKTATSNPALSQWVDTLTALAALENLNSISVTTWGASPGQLTNFASKWKYVKKRIVLEAGQDKTVYLKSGPQCYDFSKQLVGDKQSVFPRGKGLSTFWILKRPLLNQVDFNGGHSTQHRGSTFPRSAGLTSAWGVTCEIIEKYVIEAPEISNDAQKFDKFAMNCYQNQASASAPHCQLGLTTNQTYTLQQTNEVNPQTIVGITG